jgi:hypothetical protein
VASPGVGFNKFGYVSGAIEDRVIHLVILAGPAPAAVSVLSHNQLHFQQGEKRSSAVLHPLESALPGQFFALSVQKNTRSELRVFFI